MREDILDEQFPAGYAPNYSASPRGEDYEGALDDEEEDELENEPSPEPWEAMTEALGYMEDWEVSLAINGGYPGE